MVKITVLRAGGVPGKVGEGKESSSEPSRPSKKRNFGHMMAGNAYPIDYITCATTHTDLLKFRNLYHIPEVVLLLIPGKGDVPSRPPRGYVTMGTITLSTLLCSDTGWYASGSRSASPEWVEGSLSHVCAMEKVWT